jgi:hypothetical protein
MINPRGLLFIEPRGPVTAPVDDELTQAMRSALVTAVPGIWVSENLFRPGSGWRGFHTCACGARSTGYDYQIRGGMITNSLAVHYLRDHREEVPETELDKVRTFFAN